MELCGDKSNIPRTNCGGMEAKDGSVGFDFAGTYTDIVPHQVIEYSFGDREARVEFAETQLRSLC